MSQRFYGGQAILEGVMMRGANTFAVAVRTASGEIRLHHEPLTAWIYTSRLGKWPFIRGLGLLWEALGLGIRAIIWSADIAAQDIAEEENRKKAAEAPQDAASSPSADEDTEIRFQGPLAWTTVGFSFLLGIGLFFLLPTLASRWIVGFLGENPYLDATIEGAVRILLFTLYFILISFMKDIRRMFGFHGAEHKAINAFEAGSDLSVQDVQRYSVQHVRCGTSFILFVVIISIILFFPLSFAGVEPVWLALLLRLVSRLLLLPFVAGIAYELIRFSANHKDNPWLRFFILPGLLLQKATTRPPDDDMVQTAVAALIPVLESDGITVSEETKAVLADQVVLTPMSG